MDKVLGVAILAVAAALVFVAMFLAWRRRRRAASSLTGDAPFEGATVISSYEGLYVATTQRENHLERVFAPGLTYRARLTVVTLDEGIALSPRGERDTWMSFGRIDGIGRSQLTIDRVVEAGGLTRIDWLMTDGDARVPVSTFLRLNPESHDEIAEFLNASVPNKKERSS